MTPERWRAVKEVLHSCLELDPSERQAYLSKVAVDDSLLQREVEALIEVYEGDREFLEGGPQLADDPVRIPDPVVGSRIGAYRIAEAIGSGGMGVVYRAYRDDDEYQQEVAVKLVRRDLEPGFGVSQFRRERQILAFLNHGSIARLMDGGVTEDGRPYLVMEYVDGKPITAYCQERRLPLADRLRLFRAVCAGVEYAHRHLIVHKDLKPGNIFITPTGEPKLLDFGIARLIVPDVHESGDVTLTRVFALSPDYASPEQIRRQRVTTATDVYSLGVILYELLTGARAQQFKNRTPAEIQRVICEQEPLKPSAAAVSQSGLPFDARILAGDLDNIVMKALEKDPARRYSSVEQFSQDLEHYLQGRPVTARAQNLSYRAGKFLRRHKFGSAAAALLLLTLAGGAAGIAWQASVAQAERDKAQALLVDLRKLTTSGMFELEEAIATQGSTAAREILIKRSLEYVDRIARDAAGDPSLQLELAAVYARLGDVQGGPARPNSGNTSAAVESYRKALAIHETLCGGGAGSAEACAALAASYTRIGAVLKVAGDYSGGLEQDFKALDVLKNLVARYGMNRERKLRLAETYHSAGGSLSQLGRWREVIEVRREALALFEELAAAEPSNIRLRTRLSLAHTRLGSVFMETGEVREGMRHGRKAVELDSSLAAQLPGHTEALAALAASSTGLGRALMKAGNHSEAFMYFDKAKQLRERLYAVDGKNWRLASQLASSYTQMGHALLNSGKVSRAVEWYQKGLALREKLAAADPMNMGARGEIAESYAALGDTARILSQKRAALGWYRRAAGIYDDLGARGNLNAASRADSLRVKDEIAGLHKAPPSE